MTMTKRMLVLFCVLTLALSLTVAGEDCLKCAVKGYVKALNAQEVDKAKEMMADELRFVGPEGEAILDRGALLSKLGWGSAGSTISHGELFWEGDTVRGRFTEGETSYAIEFRFENKQIHEMRMIPVKS